jgi:hypothetical protein
VNGKIRPRLYATHSSRLVVVGDADQVRRVPTVCTTVMSAVRILLTLEDS